jgi:hypothetical protein
VRRAHLAEPRADEEVALPSAENRSELQAVPRADAEAERPDGLGRAHLAVPRADEEVALPSADDRLELQAVPWVEAERPDGLGRAHLAEPRADEEVALPSADDRLELQAVPWVDPEAERPDGLGRAHLAEPRADEEVALPSAEDRSELQAVTSARLGARPLVFLRSPSSPQVPPTRPNFLQPAGSIPMRRRSPLTFVQSESRFAPVAQAIARDGSSARLLAQP